MRFLGPGLSTGVSAMVYEHGPSHGMCIKCARYVCKVFRRSLCKKFILFANYTADQLSNLT